MNRDLPLGQATPYPERYDPTLLVAIPRREGRERLGLSDPPPFDGVDVWNAYELSWLDARGKPVVATGEIRVPASSPNLVESKSFKLYLNSLNGERLDTADLVAERIRADLTGTLGVAPNVRLTAVAEAPALTLAPPAGVCLDDLEVQIDTYSVDPGLLDGSVRDDAPEHEETVFSHLLRSRCPVTGQPDWATVTLRYRGPPIEHAALLRYLVSFRDHDEFHEQCVERLFADVKQHCRPSALSVLARYTRRGGLDINPFRSDFERLDTCERLLRQ